MAGSVANVRSMRAVGRLCADAGLQVREAAGWTTRGRSPGLQPAYAVVHHTAAPVDVDRLLVAGRTDLAGPLCNFALHRDGTVLLIASGVANHAGVATVSNSQSYGIEATGPVPLTATGPGAFPNYQAYVTLCAAIRLHHQWPAGRVVGHKEVCRPAGRKIDPAFDMHGFRAAVDQRVRAWGTDEEDEMTPEDRKWLETKLDETMRRGVRFSDHGDDKTPGAGNHLARVREDLAGLKTGLAPELAQDLAANSDFIGALADAVALRLRS